MDKRSRKELLEAYKQIKIHMGVIQITNQRNGKIYIAASSNLKNYWINLQGQLTLGIYKNTQLLKEWKEYGVEAFVFEVLEQKTTEDISDMRWELKQMEKAWLEKLQPYGEKGYNNPPR